MANSAQRFFNIIPPNASSRKEDATSGAIIEKNKLLNVKRKLVRVTDISDFQIGEHIVFNRWYGIEHHAIITSIKADTKEITIVEYATGDKCLEAIIKETTVPLTNFKMINKFIYDEEYLPEVVIKRAKSRINEKKYKLFSNNCEHLATWAKTGNSCSKQVKYGKKSARDSLITTSGKVTVFPAALCKTYKFIAPIVNDFIEILLKLLAKVNLLPPSEIAISVPGFVYEVSELLKFSNRLGAALGGFLTIVVALIELVKLINERENYDDEVFKEKLRETLFSWIFAIIASILAALVFTPTGIFGVIGSAVLVFLATFFAKYLGKMFSRILDCHFSEIKKDIINFKDFAVRKVKNAAVSVKRAVSNAGSNVWCAFKSWWKR